MAATAAVFPQAFVTHARSCRFSLPPATPNNARRSRLRRRGRDARDASLGDEWTDDEDDALSLRRHSTLRDRNLTRSLTRERTYYFFDVSMLAYWSDGYDNGCSPIPNVVVCRTTHWALTRRRTATNTNAADTNSGISRSAATMCRNARIDRRATCETRAPTSVRTIWQSTHARLEMCLNLDFAFAKLTSQM